MAIRHGSGSAISDSSCCRVTLGLTNAVYCKNILGEIDSYCDNAHGFPLSWFC